MTNLKQLLGGLVGLGIIVVAPARATEAPAFRIMNDQEIAAHTAAMANLQGTARDDYRNAQYEQLKIRAQKQGYRMPPSPPWAGAPADAPAEADTAASEAAARHEAMREKLQARRDEMQKASEANLTRPQEAAGVQQQEVQTQAQVPTAEPTSPVTSTDALVARSEPAPASPVADGMAAKTPDAIPGPYASATPPAVEAPAAAETPIAPPMPAEPRFAPPPPAITGLAPAPAAAPPMADAPPPAPATDGADAQRSATEPTDSSVSATAMQFENADAMAAYRESMRSRFDMYMSERQAQHEENMRRQREQREATLEQNRAIQANRNRFQPYPYPAMPAYGPRYPAAYPGYRTPYWQQQ